MNYSVTRYHDISCGHRVVGHESKCRHLHGHNYRIHFKCQARKGYNNLDAVGRVIDFSGVKELLCMWVENNWDHKFLVWEKDPVFKALQFSEAQAEEGLTASGVFASSLVFVPFNPTAENMARYLVEVIGVQQFQGSPIRLVQVCIEETAKCSATYSLSGY